jgi:hypothetical protein
MPALIDADRRLIVEEINTKNRTAGFDSLNDAEMLAFVAAVDDWIVANQAAFNAALPQPARGALDAAEKAWAFSLIVRRRWRVGIN